MTVTDVTRDGIPDILIPDEGSNDVIVLVGSGNGASWTLKKGPRLHTDGGPVATAVADLNGDGLPDLLVVNSQAGTLQAMRGVGGGFYDDQSTLRVPVGPNPAGLLVGEFDGSPGLDVVVLDSGNSVSGSTGGLTFLSNLKLNGPVPQPIRIGNVGANPVAAVASDVNGNGVQDIVVISRDDGRVSLLQGSPTGPQLISSVPFQAVSQGTNSGGLRASVALGGEFIQPTAISFAGEQSGQFFFYVAARGFDSARFYSFALNGRSLFEGNGGISSGSGGNPGELPPGYNPAPGSNGSSSQPPLTDFAAPILASIGALLNAAGSELLTSIVTELIGQGAVTTGLISIGSSSLAVVATFVVSPSFGNRAGFVNVGRLVKSTSPLIGPGSALEPGEGDEESNGEGSDQAESEEDSDVATDPDSQAAKSRKARTNPRNSAANQAPAKIETKQASAVDRFLLRLDRSIEGLHEEATQQVDEAAVHEVAESVAGSNAPGGKVDSREPSVQAAPSSTPPPNAPTEHPPKVAPIRPRSASTIDSRPEHVQSLENRGAMAVSGVLTCALIWYRTVAIHRLARRLPRLRRKPRNAEGPAEG